MRRTVPLLFLLPLLSLLSPGGAAADTPEQERDRGPTVATDAFYVGMRGVPHVALLLGWDVDIYVTGTRAISMGPSISVSFLGEEPSTEGQRQEILAAVDFLRWKFQLNRVGSPVRWHVLAGAGMYFAALPEQSGPIREIRLASGETTDAYVSYPYAEGFGAQMAVGIGVDLFVERAFGVTLQTLGRIRLDDEMERVPRFWGETSIGIRFGA